MTPSAFIPQMRVPSAMASAIAMFDDPGVQMGRSMVSNPMLRAAREMHEYGAGVVPGFRDDVASAATRGRPVRDASAFGAAGVIPHFRDDLASAAAAGGRVREASAQAERHLQQAEVHLVRSGARYGLHVAAMGIRDAPLSDTERASYQEAARELSRASGLPLTDQRLVARINKMTADVTNVLTRDVAARRFHELTRPRTAGLEQTLTRAAKGTADIGDGSIGELTGRIRADVTRLGAINVRGGVPPLHERMGMRSASLRPAIRAASEVLPLHEPFTFLPRDIEGYVNRLGHIRHALSWADRRSLERGIRVAHRTGLNETLTDYHAQALRAMHGAAAAYPPINLARDTATSLVRSRLPFGMQHDGLASDLLAMARRGAGRRAIADDIRVATSAVEPLTPFGDLIGMYAAAGIAFPVPGPGVSIRQPRHVTPEPDLADSVMHEAPAGFPTALDVEEAVEFVVAQPGDVATELGLVVAPDTDENADIATLTQLSWRCRTWLADYPFWAITTWTYLWPFLTEEQREDLHERRQKVAATFAAGTVGLVTDAAIEGPFTIALVIMFAAYGDWAVEVSSLYRKLRFLRRQHGLNNT